MSDFKKLISAFCEEPKKAVKQDGTEAIVLGCTGMDDALRRYE